MPSHALMTDFEIAALFEVFTSTIRFHIKAILRNRIIKADISHGATVKGSSLIPDYFGIDMIIALAFRINSPKAELFRESLLKKMNDMEEPEITLYINLVESQNIS